MQKLTAQAIDNAAGRTAGTSLPLALKWSLSIAALVVIVMGMLAWFLINQEEAAFQRQSEQMGIMMVSQLASSASEPLLAGDDLALKVLVTQQEKIPLIIGMQVFDREGNVRVDAGLSPFEEHSPDLNAHPLFSNMMTGGMAWSSGGTTAVSYGSEVRFQDVVAGYVMVSLDRAPFEQDLARLVNALIATTLGLIVLGVLLAIPLAHRLCRPIYKLVEASEAIHSGQAVHFVAENRDDEIGRVLDIFQNMAAGLKEKRVVEEALYRYVSPNVAQKLLGADAESMALGGATTTGSVLFCDIVGFTELSEKLPPEELMALLNHYFSYFALAGSSCGGTVDKFIGDCVMILFGVPEPDEMHALHAVTCGTLIQEIAQRISSQRKAAGLPTVSFRVGINSGSVLAGNLGSEQRMQYTVVGDVVNVASRICDLCEPHKILLTRETAVQPAVGETASLVRRDSVTVKGRSRNVELFEMELSGFGQRQLITSHLEAILPGEETP
ncbi:MAG: adenylate/guanylate cyclase domain-containing protein [Sedimenticola sp.]